MTESDRKLMEQWYRDTLAVLRNPNSSFEDVVKVPRGYVSMPADSAVPEDWDASKKFSRKVINPLYRERISKFIKSAKTFDEAVSIWAMLPRDKYREEAALRALEFANAKQCLELYRRVHFGEIGQKILFKASNKARTQSELWQVADHAFRCGNKKLWKETARRLAQKLKL